MPKERETLEITSCGDCERSAKNATCEWQNVVWNPSKPVPSTSGHLLEYDDQRLPKWLVLIAGVVCLLCIGFLVRRNS